ncbi:CCN family member 3-like [Spea bombifrons]|uniref:CCN family member 3-like n=1 Tax=Spea bombifrons TaxID=233779 RepID=UPI00234ABB78|nr:CCN family member 3-like [Spea bombifrons]
MDPQSVICFMLLLVKYGAAETEVTATHAQGCPAVCECPAVISRCPTGSHRVLDGCGCGCQVCAQALDAPCDGLRPCDPAHNLTCDYFLGQNHQEGVCKVLRKRRSCFPNGTEILHGQRFQDGCTGSCVCHDGQVGCVSLCPPYQPAAVPGCREMVYEAVPGQCCKRWKCKKYDSADNLLPKRELFHPNSNKVINKTPAAGKRSRKIPDREHGMALNSSSVCKKPPTEWTPCSRLCGFGVSVRIQFEAESCTPRAERRLCMIRPCREEYGAVNYTLLKTTKVCNRVVRWTQPQHLHHRECHTLRPLSPKFCGGCSDGRVCTPSLTETRSVVFQCPHGNRRVKRKIMWVLKCRCGRPEGKKGERRMEKAEGRVDTEEEDVRNEIEAGG